MVPPRHQRVGSVELHLDGDAQARVWSPNIVDPDRRVDMDLLPKLAAWASMGIGGDVPEPHRDDSLCLLFEVDLGHNGTATLGGDPISPESVSNLVAAGWLHALRLAAKGATADSEADSPAAAEAAAPDTGGS